MQRTEIQSLSLRPALHPWLQSSSSQFICWNPFCSLPNNTAFIGRKFQLLPAPAIAPLRHIAHPKPIRLVFLSLLPHFPAEGGLACMHCCESSSGWRWDLRHVSSALGAAPHDAFAKAPAKPPPAVLISLFPLSGTKSHSGV